MQGNVNQTVYAVTVRGHDRSIYWPQLLRESEAEAIVRKLNGRGFTAESWPVSLRLPEPSTLVGPAIKPWNAPASLKAVASPGEPLYASEDEYRNGPVGRLWQEFSSSRVSIAESAASEPPKRGDEGKSEPFETLEAALLVRSVVQVPVACEPLPFPRTLIERHPDGYTVHDFNIRREGDPGSGLFTRWGDEGDHRPASAAVAWNSFGFCMDCSSVSVFVGPGTSPVVLDGVEADPRCFQVWNADAAGAIVLAGKSIHRLGAMAIAKQVAAEGGCPVVMSHYLEPDLEWECDSVDELPAPASALAVGRASE